MLGASTVAIPITSTIAHESTLSCAHTHTRKQMHTHIYAQGTRENKARGKREERAGDRETMQVRAWGKHTSTFARACLVLRTPMTKCTLPSTLSACLWPAFFPTSPTSLSRAHTPMSTTSLAPPGLSPPSWTLVKLIPLTSPLLHSTLSHEAPAAQGSADASFHPLQRPAQACKGARLREHS